jgi:ribosome maturation factor RimP
MNKDLKLAAIEGHLQELLAEDSAYFLISIKSRPTNNIKIFVDGDKGVNIEKCVSLNRKLYKFIEESQFYPDGDFSLEVSSPGLDEPLQLPRQYQINIGRNVEIVLADASIIEGVLKEYSDTGIIVEELKGKNKKKETVSHTIPFSNIKTTKVQVTF